MTFSCPAAELEAWHQYVSRRTNPYGWRPTLNQDFTAEILPCPWWMMEITRNNPPDFDCPDLNPVGTFFR